MKKLLTVVAVALLLCLGISFAIAAQHYEVEYKGAYTPATSENAAYADATKASNWTISSWNELGASEDVATITKVLIDPMYDHNERSTVTLEGVATATFVDENGTPVPVGGKFTAHTTIMLSEAAHKAGKAYYEVAEDGWCHKYEDCEICGERMSDKAKEHDPKNFVYEFDDDGGVSVWCSECGHEIKEYTYHEHKAVKCWWDWPNCTNGVVGTYVWACEECYCPMENPEKDPYVGKNVVAEDYTEYDGDLEMYLAEDEGEWLKELIEKGYYDVVTGHWYDEWATLIPANCVNNEVQVRVCTLCLKAEEKREVENTKLPIKFKTTYVDCDETDSFTVVCAYCNGLMNGVDPSGAVHKYTKKLSDFANYEAILAFSDTLDMIDDEPAIVLLHEYNYNKVAKSKSATCTENGYEAFACGRCTKFDADPDYYYYFWSKQTGHNMSAWRLVYAPDGENGNVYGEWIRECTNINRNTMKKCTHTERYYGTEEPGPDTIDPDVCDHANKVKNAELSYDPTCTKDGLAVYDCPDCLLQWDDAIPALGHQADETKWSEIEPAKCGVAGLKVAPCTRCEVYVYAKTDPLEHDLVAMPGQAENCTTDGWTEYQVCKREGCGKEFGKEILKADPTKDENHDWGTPNVITKSTCKDHGTAIVICTRCKVAKEISLPLSDEHDWSDWTVTPADVEKELDGKKVRVCNICGAEEEEVIPFVPTGKANYTISGFVYDMNTQEVTGSVAHTPGTEYLTEGLFVRISFYYKKDANGEQKWAAFVVPVKADMTFSMGANTDCAYVTAEIVANANQTKIPADKDVYGIGTAKIIALDD